MATCSSFPEEFRITRSRRTVDIVFLDLTASEAANLSDLRLCSCVCTHAIESIRAVNNRIQYARSRAFRHSKLARRCCSNEESVSTTSSHNNKLIVWVKTDQIRHAGRGRT